MGLGHSENGQAEQEKSDFAFHAIWKLDSLESQQTVAIT
jgi:hypothetical protein